VYLLPLIHVPQVLEVGYVEVKIEGEADPQGARTLPRRRRFCDSRAHVS